MSSKYFLHQARIMTLFGKKAVYERPGVKEYIIVDPDNKTVESFINNESKKFTQFQKQDYKKNCGKFLIKTLSLEINLKELSKAE